MNKEEFLLKEYMTLREEIKETKSRIFVLGRLGVIGMPIGYYIAYTYKIDFIMMSLPLLIVMILLFFISESRSLMRCGQYIKNNIESELQDADGKNLIGWEHWLEASEKGRPGRRNVDQIITIFFYSLFFFYYFASALLARPKIYEEFGKFARDASSVIYALLFLGFVWFLKKNYKYIISTDV